MTRRAKKSQKSLWMMLVAIILIGVLIFMLPSCGQQTKKPTIDEATLVVEGDVAPDFEVQMTDSTTLKLHDLKGKVVLVNFWATWCPPCREELKRVGKDIVERFEGRNFQFIPISRGEKSEDVVAFAQKMSYTFPMGLDPEKAIYDRYAQNYIPRNFLVDQQGKVVWQRAGYDAKEFDEMIQKIEELLQK